MNDRELHDFLLQQNQSLVATIEAQTKLIESLTKEVEALKELLLKEGDKSKGLAAKLNGLAKITLPKKTEKQASPKPKESKKPSPTPKERGNNGAKRKVLNVEEIVSEIFPSNVDFNVDKARLMTSKDTIRYEFVPPKLIKHIYRCMRYVQDGKIYEGKAPLTPLVGSNYSSSFIAYLIQQRYVYAMPVERIGKHLKEMNIDVTKQNLHKLLARAADILDKLTPVLKNAILESSYIHFDETYHQIIDKKANGGSRKGYFWAALAHQSKLLQFFYNNGSRGSEVFKNYLPTKYKGAIQTDGYICYKAVEGWNYINTVRLACIQHCKRKFVEIENDTAAKKIVRLYNRFYNIRKRNPKERWIKLSEVVYKELETALREIEKDPKRIADSELQKAVAYALNELEAVHNTISSTEYDLDNNEVERPMRYISMSRRSSMFCGSHEGAQRTALLYSLAISCRLNNVNTFAYFNDIIMKAALLPPNANEHLLRDMLPDKWANTEN